MKFYKGHKEILVASKNKWSDLSMEFSKLLDINNLSFLFGSGCSSHIDNGGERGIPTMLPLANEYFGLLTEEVKAGWNNVHIRVDNPLYSSNLEAFNEAILNYRNYLAQILDGSHAGHTVWVESQIEHLQKFILKKCTAPFSARNGAVVELYKTFYRKLIFRDRNLPKPNIFTTNYDVFSEKAMDSLGVHYSNGFSGVIDRYFNPSVFDYAFSENLNVNDNKWQVIDHYIFLYKLHGSINWVYEPTEGQLYGVKEIQDVSYQRLSSLKNIMIYPSPSKQSTSLSSPYTDMFREFKYKLSKQNNVLVVVGYSFNDEHVNNLIYQALAKPTFRLVVLGDPDNYANFIDLKDPRIWVIGGRDDDGTEVHYFKSFVDRVMPDLSGREIEESIDRAIKKLVKQNVGG